MNQIATTRPSRTDIKPFQELTCNEMFKDPRTVQQMADIVPKHLTPERMSKVVLQALFKTPKLAQCHPMTLLGAVMSLGSLGLEPNTPLGHAYLIPFENRRKGIVEVQAIIGYKGFIDLARRSGSMKSIHADVVYEGDEFSFEYGSKMHLTHRPIGKRVGRTPIWAYCHVTLTDGEAFEVLPYEQVLEIRNKSQAYKMAVGAKDRGKSYIHEASPWVAYEHEMAAKTMIRRIAKSLPLSIEMANAVQLDEMSDRGDIGFSKIPANQTMIADFSAAEFHEEEPKEPEPEKQKAKPSAKKAAAKKSEQEDPGPEVSFDIIDVYGEVLGAHRNFETSPYDPLVFETCKEHLSFKDRTSDEFQAFIEHNEEALEYIKSGNQKHYDELMALCPYPEEEKEEPFPGDIPDAPAIEWPEGGRGGVTWKADFLKAVTTAPNTAYIDNLVAVNKDGLAKLKELFPGSHKKLKEEVEAKRKSFA